MVKYLLIFLFAATSAHAGLFGGPSAKDLEKVIRAPVAGKSDLPVRELISLLESRAGHRGSWIGNQFVIEMRDKTTLKMMKQKYSFEFTDTEAILNEVIAGKDVLDGQALGWLFVTFYNETDRGKANEKKRRAADEASSNKTHEELKQEDPVIILKKLQGKYCNQFGVKLDIELGGKSDAVVSLSGNGCSMNKSMPIKSSKSRPGGWADDPPLYEVSMILNDSPDENNSCLMKLNTLNQNNSISAEINCSYQIVEKIIGCGAGNVNAIFSKCTR